MPPQRVSAIVPVGAPTPLLDECLAALAAQTEPIHEVIVVDDSAAGALATPAGVRVLRSGGSGPYAARNVGWRAAAGDVLLFLDVRSRPRPQWAERLAAAFEDPAVALAGSDVLIRGGETLGARVSERQQFYKLEKYTTEAWFRPYFPTCNLAARRSDVEAVEGFAEIRSGADADLCWRILDRPGRRFAPIPEVLMEWVPRETLRGYLEQNYRYGRSHRALRTTWADRGAPRPVGMSYPVLARRIAGVLARGAVAAARGRDDELLEQLRRGGRFAYHVGYRRRTVP
jgi:glycosyltransferase involved in cell wall biosynthesis